MFDRRTRRARRLSPRDERGSGRGARAARAARVLRHDLLCGNKPLNATADRCGQVDVRAGRRLRTRGEPRRSRCTLDTRTVATASAAIPVASARDSSADTESPRQRSLPPRPLLSQVVWRRSSFEADEPEQTSRSGRPLRVTYRRRLAHRAALREAGRASGVSGDVQHDEKFVAGHRAFLSCRRWP